LACFGVAAYAVTRVLKEGGWWGVFLWFGACLVIHDLVGWPIYSAADRMLVRAEHRRAAPGRGPQPNGAFLAQNGGIPARPRVPWVNHVRFPTVISSVLLGMFFPLIFRISSSAYVASTGLSENPYLTNWLAVTAVLFAASALIYLLRFGLASRRLAKRPQ
jgi:hypothetical protein